MTIANIQGSMPLDGKLWSRLVERPDGCWQWTGATFGKRGYGQINTHKVNGKWVKAMVHRVAYKLVKGDIPDGLVIDHLCRNRLCCNPDHLEPVTIKENIRRGLKVALKTHCWRGHPFDEANTGITKEGDRRCRKCAAITTRACYARKKAKNAK